MQDLVTGEVFGLDTAASAANFSMYARNGGVGVKTTAYIPYGYRLPHAGTKFASMLAVASVESANVRGEVFSTNPAEYFGFNGTLYPYITNYSGGLAVVGSAAFSEGTTATIAARWRQYNYGLFANGVKVATQDSGAWGDSFIMGTTVNMLGNSAGFNSSMMAAQLAMAWSLHLTDAELIEATRNPWQLFQPYRRRFYISTGSGFQPAWARGANVLINPRL